MCKIRDHLVENVRTINSIYALNGISLSNYSHTNQHFLEPNGRIIRIM